MSDDVIRVLLADDHSVVRTGLKAVLGTARDISVVGEASNGREAADKVRALRPDVVLMDLLMPEMDGISATKAIKEFAPEVKIIVLTSFQDDEHIMPAIEAGATGYLLKDVSAPELVKAIEGAFQGQAQLHPEVARKLMEQVRQPRRRDDPAEDLTPRERDVLALMAEGLGNSAIAERLFVTEGAVHKHIRSIFAKLDLPPTDRTDRRVAAVLHYLERV